MTTIEKATEMIINMYKGSTYLDSSVKEVIAELKALQQPKSCDGCKYETLYDSQVICTNKLPCGRNYFIDRYKSKEQ